MKEIRDYPVFKGIRHHLEASLELAQRSLLQKIDAANELAAEVLELVPELQIRDLLRLPARDTLSEYKYSILADKPKLCLLAIMIMKGIEQSQNPDDDRVLSALVSIQKVEADKLSYTQDSKWKNTFEKISEWTNGFIAMESCNQTTNTEEISISFICNFKKEFPQKVEA